MRLHFALSPATESLSFEYPHQLTGVLHRWLGEENSYHHAVSLYSIGWLQGGKVKNDRLNFRDGAKWCFSAWQPDLYKQVLNSAMTSPDVIGGMTVKEVVLENVPDFGNKHRFLLNSPVLIKEKDAEGKISFLTFFDGEQASEQLAKTLVYKMQAAGLASEHQEVKIYFDKKYSQPKTKLVTVKGIQNKASFCPVIIEGTKEALQFAWCVGIGHSTGVGFGCLE